MIVMSEEYRGWTKTAAIKYAEKFISPYCKNVMKGNEGKCIGESCLAYPFCTDGSVNEKEWKKIVDFHQDDAVMLKI